MNRKDFLKGLGLAGAASVLPAGIALNRLKADNEPPSSCVLIPTETEGPFPLDLSANTAFFRQDIREDKTGIQLNLRLKIIGQDNCYPMSNVRVNIWHCDKDGLYSGYSLNNNPGQAGKTYLRGYQITDANGEVEFITILPGWYQGRVCHIHFQVYVSSSYSVISQLTFDPAIKNAIYAANSGLYTKGSDPLTIDKDDIFADGYAYQLATLTQDTATGGYESYLEVTVKGSGSLSTGYIEKQNEKVFALGQNFPNPYNSSTTIPFTLKTAADVRLDLYDLMGRKVATIDKADLNSGEHRVDIDVEKLGLAPGNYVYQINVRTASGTYTDHKMMTALR